MEVVPEVIENVFEPRKILRRCLAKRLVRIQHFFFCLQLILFGRSAGRVALNGLTLGSGRSVGLNAENLIQPKTGEQFAAALAAMHDAQMSLPKLFQAQGDPRHRAHKRGIHHLAIGQIDHELAETAIHHFTGKLFETAAVKKATFAFYSHPNGWPIYPYLNRRLHD